MEKGGRRSTVSTKFNRCVKSVRKTVKARRGSSKESAAIAICTTTILHPRKRTLKSYRRGRLVTQKRKVRGGGVEDDAKTLAMEITKQMKTQNDELQGKLGKGTAYGIRVTIPPSPGNDAAIDNMIAKLQARQAAKSALQRAAAAVAAAVDEGETPLLIKLLTQLKSGTEVEDSERNKTGNGTGLIFTFWAKVNRMIGKLTGLYV
jgi:hypothetical protein